MTSKHKLLISIALLALTCGAVTQRYFPYPQQSPSDLVLMFGGTLALFVWCRIDSDQRGYKRTRALDIAVVALAGLALPYYFFRSRGFVSGLSATAIFLVCVLAAGVLEVLGSYGMYAVQSS